MKFKIVFLLFIFKSKKAFFSNLFRKYLSQSSQFKRRKFPHATSCSERALSNELTMIGRMAIVIALHGFNDIGCSVTLTFFPETDQSSTHCPKMNKKINVGS